MGVGAERHALAALAPRKRAGLSGPRGLCGWVTENLTLTDLRNPDRPSSTESLKREKT